MIGSVTLNHGNPRVASSASIEAVARSDGHSTHKVDRREHSTVSGPLLSYSGCDPPGSVVDCEAPVQWRRLLGARITTAALGKVGRIRQLANREIRSRRSGIGKNR
jgi:hypothetical protein